MLQILRLVKEWSTDCPLSWWFLKTAVTQPPEEVFGYDLTSLQTSLYVSYLLNLTLTHYSKMFSHACVSRIGCLCPNVTLVPVANLDQILDLYPRAAAIIVKAVFIPGLLLTIILSIHLLQFVFTLLHLYSYTVSPRRGWAPSWVTKADFCC